MIHDVTTRVGVRLRPYVGPVVRHLGEVTSSFRVPPSVLIVGTQRGGTTSLFRSLRQHPGFLGPTHRKGVHYFDVKFDRGPAWYLGHFPLRSTVAKLERTLQFLPTVGEASPYYMAHPLAAARIKEMLPTVRTIALLRDPIERAYSAFTHEQARGFETRTFEEAVESEPELVRIEVDRVLRDPTYQSEVLRHNSYLTRGHYIEQLQRLASELDREQILVIDSHRFFTEPEEQFDRVLRFIGLPAVDGISHDRHNARSRAPLTPGMRQQLQEHFEPYDAALEAWLGWTPSWMTQPRP